MSNQLLQPIPTRELHLSEIVDCLNSRGLKFRDHGRYLLSQCPQHSDTNPSAQIYKDDFFVNCHVCGRLSPYHAFPELRSNGPQGPYMTYKLQKGNQTPMDQNEAQQTHYKTFNLMEYWNSLPWLQPHFSLHGVPVTTLHNLGWRQNDGKAIAGSPGDIFIPYFSRSKESIPFAQVRHFNGNRRFSFLKDAKPTCYGTWNLEPGDKIFIVEGTSDCAVLEYCNIPWVGLPSSSSGKLLRDMLLWCKANNVKPVYAGDNDEAGDKLKAVMDEIMPYRVWQPPKQFKDWGEMLEKAGFEAVVEYGNKELYA